MEWRDSSSAARDEESFWTFRVRGGGGGAVVDFRRFGAESSGVAAMAVLWC